MAHGDSSEAAETRDVQAPDRAVRARTRAGRLAALDAWLVHTERELLAGEDTSCVVDVGFGESPVTTLELAAALRAVSPSLVVTGLERDEARVAAAAAAGDARTRFVAGGLEALEGLAPVRLVRAMNVLRGYRVEEVPLAHEALGRHVTEAGLVVEGSTDTDGHVLTAHLLRKRRGALVREALLFFTDFTRGFSPWLFRDWLPRDFRRRVQAGTAMHDFLSRWEEAWEDARDRGVSGAPGLFAASVEGLAQRVRGVDADAWASQHGYLRWAPPGGVPDPGPKGRC